MAPIIALQLPPQAKQLVSSAEPEGDQYQGKQDSQRPPHDFGFYNRVTVLGISRLGDCPIGHPYNLEEGRLSVFIGGPDDHIE